MGNNPPQSLASDHPGKLRHSTSYVHNMKLKTFEYMIIKYNDFFILIRLCAAAMFIRPSG